MAKRKSYETGADLKAVRHKLKLSQSELAEALNTPGIDRARIAKLEAVDKLSAGWQIVTKFLDLYGPDRL